MEAGCKDRTELLGYKSCVIYLPFSSSVRRSPSGLRGGCRERRHRNRAETAPTVADDCNTGAHCCRRLVRAFAMSTSCHHLWVMRRAPLGLSPSVGSSVSAFWSLPMPHGRVHESSCRVPPRVAWQWPRPSNADGAVGLSSMKTAAPRESSCMCLPLPHCVLCFVGMLGLLSAHVLAVRPFCVFYFLALTCCGATRTPPLCF